LAGALLKLSDELGRGHGLVGRRGVECNRNAQQGCEAEGRDVPCWTENGIEKRAHESPRGDLVLEQDLLAVAASELHSGDPTLLHVLEFGQAFARLRLLIRKLSFRR